MSNSQKCGCTKRKICSNIVSDICKKNSKGCYDVCVEPKCGEPDLLTVLAPVIYDEIGINLCTTVNMPTTIVPLSAESSEELTSSEQSKFPWPPWPPIPPAELPTCVSIEVIDICIPFHGPCKSSVTQMQCRPKCYAVTLTNLKVKFAVTYYDVNRQVIGTHCIEDVIFLPCNTDCPYYNEDTNPSAVTLGIFAPYGVAYHNGNVHKPTINTLGFSSNNTSLNQGLNLSGMAKVLDVDNADHTLTIGLTLVLQSIYFSQYKLRHDGKAFIPKGNLSSEEDTLCMEFVEGDLLDKNIKPLELGYPKCEEKNKKSTDDGCDNCDYIDPCQ